MTSKMESNPPALSTLLPQSLPKPAPVLALTALSVSGDGTQKSPQIRPPLAQSDSKCPGIDFRLSVINNRAR